LYYDLCFIYKIIYILLNIEILNKILRQNAYIIRKIDSELGNKKKDKVQLDQAFIEVILYQKLKVDIKGIMILCCFYDFI
jgi:hypothetical protein